MSESNSSGGIGFTGLLAILFIGLKLTGYIDWSWWWVLAPLWICAVLILFIVAVVSIAYWFDARSARNARMLRKARP